MSQHLHPGDPVPFRIGAVSYLNSKPLIYSLEELVGGPLVVDLPSRLAAGLANNDLDVALIPSIEYARNGGYTIVSDACISCNGPVKSVMLYSRVPVEQIQTLALDEGSRTSATLVRILLAERFDVHPRTVPLPIGSTASDSDANAVMLIGDRGMIPIDGHYEFVWDLGQEWCDWTGLPFVFAMWVARGELSEQSKTSNISHQEKLKELGRLLGVARNRGLENLEEIARREAPIVGIPFQQCYEYFRDNLTFRLGPAQRRGLALFYELAAQHDLAPHGVKLAFTDNDIA